MIVKINVDDNSKTIESVILLHKQNVFCFIFQLAVTSSTDVFKLKNAFRTLLKRFHPDKNGNNTSATLAQHNILEEFQYLKQEEEMVEIERQRLWERNRVFQEQREEKNKKNNENREKEEKIGLRNMNHLLITT